MKTTNPEELTMTISTVQDAVMNVCIGAVSLNVKKKQQ